ncbi:MAG TPA: tripartite tricarboxylate transporter substrate binding protein, partial [Pseudorhodoferax sp.]|nr:tripartite tricarboxylate transporter substrate binding protein [Pseudorhodoferax sp.]
VERLQREITAIARAPRTVRELEAKGITVEHNTPAAFTALIRADHARWGRVIKDSDVRIE